jgi:hypothetical protein
MLHGNSLNARCWSKNILFPRGNQNYELKLLFLFLMG